eukprot:jgi/Chrzof1/6256/Cz17g17190.t1
MAAECDHATVEQLLAAGNEHVKRTAANGATALHEAAEKGCAVCIQALLQAGADVSACMMQVQYHIHYKDEGLTPLHCAAACNNAGAVSLLVAAGADVNSESTACKVTPLQLAADAGHIQVVQALLDAGADVNHVDGWGLTALRGCF